LLVPEKVQGEEQLQGEKYVPFQHDEFEVPVGHIQVDMYSGKLDLSLRLRQAARVTHLEVLSITTVASECRKVN